jgi:hypothetical protein
MTTERTRELINSAKQARLVPLDRKARGRQQLLAAMAAGTMTATAMAAEAAALTSTPAAAVAVGAGSAVGASGSLVGLAASAIAVGMLTGTVMMSPASDPVHQEPTLSATTLVQKHAPARPTLRDVIRPSIAQGTARVSPLPPAMEDESREPATATDAVSLPNAERNPLQDRGSITSAAVKGRALVVAKPNPSALEEETRLLQLTQSALRHGLHAEALQLLTQYEQAFPRGGLREEATALRVLVHCGAGRVAEARRDAERFVAHYAHSAFLGRLLTTCPQAFSRATP